MTATLGWFGDAWPSFVCYDSEWNLRENAHLPFPAGKKCIECRRVFEPGDAGERVIVGTIKGWATGFVHRECQLLAILGENAGPLEERRTAALRAWAQITKDAAAAKPAAAVA
jgi:hypothetical protein